MHANIIDHFYHEEDHFSFVFYLTKKKQHWTIWKTNMFCVDIWFVFFFLYCKRICANKSWAQLSSHNISSLKTFLKKFTLNLNFQRKKSICKPRFFVWKLTIVYSLYSLVQHICCIFQFKWLYWRYLILPSSRLYVCIQTKIN